MFGKQFEEREKLFKRRRLNDTNTANIIEAISAKAVLNQILQLLAEVNKSTSYSNSMPTKL